MQNELVISNQTWDENLQSYGLNPYDWLIIPQQNNLYLVESLEDPEFSFWAETDAQQNLRTLELRSI